MGRRRRDGFDESGDRDQGKEGRPERRNEREQKRRQEDQEERHHRSTFDRELDTPGDPGIDDW